MNRGLKIFLWIAGIAVVLFLLAIPKIKKKSEEKAGGQKGNAPAIPVTIVVANPQELELKVEATGTVLANEEVELKPESSGRVTGVYFKEGSRVEKGMLLVKINDADLQAQHQRLTYRLKLAEANEKRSKVLYDKEGISLAEYEMVLSELNVIKADLSLIEAQIRKTEIRAPFSGIVGLKNLSEGAYVSSSTSVASLQDLSNIKIDFSIPERYASALRKGNKIVFDVEGVGKGFTGEIYAIDPKIDPVTRTVQIRAIASNRSGKIFAGSFAHITLVMDKVKDAIMVPTEAVVPDIKGHKIFLFKSGKTEVRPVEIGVRREKDVQVLKGIALMDTVITTGILQLRPGASVKIKEGGNR